MRDEDDDLLPEEDALRVMAQMEQATGMSGEAYAKLVLDLQNACAGAVVRADLLELAFLTNLSQVTGAYVGRGRLRAHIKKLSKIWLKYAAVAERNRGKLWPLDDGPTLQ